MANHPDAVRVALVDDHQVVTDGLRATLGIDASDLDVVAWAASVSDLLTLGVQVDVVVLDLDLKDGSNAGENVAALLAAHMRVLVLSAFGEPHMVHDAVLAGAHGFLDKARSTEDVAQAIRDIANGEEVVSAEMLRAIVEAAPRRPALSARQEELLIRVVSTDSKLPSIARAQDISYDTLKTHLQRIKDKYTALGRPTRSRWDLYRRAREDGYIDE